MPMTDRSRLAALAAAVGLTLAACGTSTGGDASGPATSDAPTEPAVTARGTTEPGPTPAPVPTQGTAPATSIFPAIDVIDVASGQAVELGRVTAGPGPTLVWFWAPH